MFGIKKTIEVKQVSQPGYVGYVRVDNGQEIGRSESQAFAWADQNNVNIKIVGGDKTPYPSNKFRR